MSWLHKAFRCNKTRTKETVGKKSFSSFISNKAGIISVKIIWIKVDVKTWRGWADLQLWKGRILVFKGTEGLKTLKTVKRKNGKICWKILGVFRNVLSFFWFKTCKISEWSLDALHQPIPAFPREKFMAENSKNPVLSPRAPF